MPQDSLKVESKFANPSLEKVVENMLEHYADNISLDQSNPDVVLTDGERGDTVMPTLYITTRLSHVSERDVLSLYNHLNILDVPVDGLCGHVSHVFYFSNLIYNFILEHYPSLSHTCLVLDPIRSLEYIIDTGKSIARFGDGEVALAEGRELTCYKEQADRFQRSFVGIMENKNPNCFVGICDIFQAPSFRYWRKREEHFWSRPAWKKRYLEFCPIDGLYLSAQISRPHHYAVRAEGGEDSKLLFDGFEFVWLKQRIVLNRRVLCVQNARFMKNHYSRILYAAASVDYFLIKEKTASDGLETISRYVLDNKDKYDVVLLLGGPTATHLASLLSTCDVQAIDLGSCQYDALTSDTNKIARNVAAIDNLVNVYQHELRQPRDHGEFSRIETLPTLGLLRGSVIWSVDKEIANICRPTVDHSSARIKFLCGSNTCKLGVVDCIFLLRSSEPLFRFYNGIRWLELESDKVHAVQLDFSKFWGVSFSMERFAELERDDKPIRMEIHDVQLRLSP